MVSPSQASKSKAKAFVKHLKTLKKEACFPSNETFGQAIGVSTSTVDKWFSGRTLPSPDILPTVREKMQSYYNGLIKRCHAFEKFQIDSNV